MFSRPHQHTPLRTYVLDTNVLITSPYSIYSFDEHNVTISDVTISELDHKKTEIGETGAHVREVIRLFDELRTEGNLGDGIQLPNGGIFKVEVNFTDVEMPRNMDMSKNDIRILRLCKGLRDKGDDAILVTNDIAMRVLANVLNIPVEEYKTEQAPQREKQYKGRQVLYLKSGVIDMLCEKDDVACIDPDILLNNIVEAPEGVNASDEFQGFYVNEFITLVDSANPKLTLTGRFNGDVILPLAFSEYKPYGVSPRNDGQLFAQECLMTSAEYAPLVILKGPAGTAKTFYSMAVGLEKLEHPTKQDSYIRMLVTRPSARFDDDIGFLKGGESEKIAPLIRPIMDNLEVLTRKHDYSRPFYAPYSKNGGGKNGKGGRNNYSEHDDYGYEEPRMSYAQSLFEQELIVAQSFAFMRGRSISDTWIVIDEAQNMTPNQAFGIISRAGVHSKIILAGDPDQIDNPHLDSRSNGLTYAAEHMKKSPLCWQVTFNQDECTRSELAKEAVKYLSPKGYRR